MNRESVKPSYFWRPFIFLFGVFLLALPVTLIFQTIEESRKRDFDLRLQAAQEKNDTALLFFRTQDSFQNILEKRLNDAILKLAKNCEYRNLRASSAELRRSVSMAKADLLQDGIVPECILICQQNENSLAFDFPVAELPGISSLSEYLLFLGKLTLQDVFEQYSGLHQE